MPVTAPSKLGPELHAQLDPAGVAGVDGVDGVANSKIVACGVTALDAAEGALVPTPLVAVTRNV